MKRQKLIKETIKKGAVFVRHGANHDIYENPRTNTSTQVPRHADINEIVAKAIEDFSKLQLLKNLLTLRRKLLLVSIYTIRN